MGAKYNKIKIKIFVVSDSLAHVWAYNGTYNASFKS